MCRILIVFTVAVTMPAAAEPAVPNVVAGKVFFDANGNGVLNAREKGIPGARVTDGVHRR